MVEADHVAAQEQLRTENASSFVGSTKQKNAMLLNATQQTNYGRGRRCGSTVAAMKQQITAAAKCRKGNIRGSTSAAQYSSAQWQHSAEEAGHVAA
eukprot:scaffold89906_cov23-Tisochrysis_lutea.AAC.1